jgi:Fe2+ or Zn2+ uptake regulation protein
MKTTSDRPCTVSEAELRRALKQAGWRCTRQRSAVFACLHAAKCHPTAEQVFAAVRRRVPHISLATVYKALEALVSAGLAARIAHESGAARYDARSDSHYHLRCERTGEVRDLPLPYDPSLFDKIAPHLVEELRSQGFEITGHRLELLARAYVTRAGFRRRNNRRNTRAQRRWSRRIQSSLAGGGWAAVKFGRKTSNNRNGRYHNT